MSAPVLDTMLSHMRTARNRTLQSEKNSLIARVFDLPAAPSGHFGVAFHHSNVLVDSEGTACSSGRFAKEGHRVVDGPLA